MVNVSSPASSWLPTTAISTPWLNPSLLTSPKAIPLYLVLLLYLLHRLPSLFERHFTPLNTPATAAYVIPAETRHARFLPTPSQHAFRYKTLYLALRLDKLESRSLDTGHAFAWKGAPLQPEFVDQAALADRRSVTPAGRAAAETEPDWKVKMRTAERIERKRLEEKRGRNERYTWSLTCLHPRAYLREQVGLASPKAAWIEGSILLKLAYELRERGYLNVGPQDEEQGGGGWRNELGQVWTVTMPSIAGVTGINPLTVHYCFRPQEFGSTSLACKAGANVEDQRGAFWLVVLEVHNTFGERHIYVLESGNREDPVAERGYDHQWTFARSFHVSPFNDRGGFYRLFLKEPFGPKHEGFVLGIRLLLLVGAEEAEGAEQGGRPKLVKKMMATLDSVSAPRSKSKVGRQVRPMSWATLYAALMRQPVDLFLTFVRILYEAAKLHFVKRLDAFGRPDIVQVSESTPDKPFDGVGLPPALNAIQAHRKSVTLSSGKEERVGGGLVYPQPAWAELVAKGYVEKLLRRRVVELKQKGVEWLVEIVSTDPVDGGLRIGEEGGRKLTLYTRSYGVYVDLMTYTPPRLALLLGSIVTRRWGVSSLHDFDAFFTDHHAPSRGIRKRHLDFLLDSSATSRTQALHILRGYNIDLDPSASSAWTDADSWRVHLALWSGLVAALGEKKVFGWLGARYVKGSEPWLSLDRGLEYVKGIQDKKDVKDEVGWDTKLGSVYHA